MSEMEIAWLVVTVGPSTEPPPGDRASSQDDDVQRTRRTVRKKVDLVIRIMYPSQQINIEGAAVTGRRRGPPMFGFGTTVPACEHPTAANAAMKAANKRYLSARRMLLGVVPRPFVPLGG